MSQQGEPAVEVARWLAFDRIVGEMRGRFVGMSIEVLDDVIAEAIAAVRGRPQ